LREVGFHKSQPHGILTRADDTPPAPPWKSGAFSAAKKSPRMETGRQPT